MKKLAEVVNKSVSMEKNSIEKMCSCGSDVAKDLSSSGATDTCGVRNNATKERYVKLLDFRHFERHMLFSQSDRKEKKKAISDGVNVSVVMEL